MKFCREFRQWADLAARNKPYLVPREATSFRDVSENLLDSFDRMTLPTFMCNVEVFDDISEYGTTQRWSIFIQFPCTIEGKLCPPSSIERRRNEGR